MASYKVLFVALAILALYGHTSCGMPTSDTADAGKTITEEKPDQDPQPSSPDGTTPAPVDAGELEGQSKPLSSAIDTSVVKDPAAKLPTGITEVTPAKASEVPSAAPTAPKSPPTNGDGTAKDDKAAPSGTASLSATSFLMFATLGLLWWS